MSTGKQFALSAVLVLGGIYVLFVHGHIGGSSAASGREKAIGTVRMKDTRPGADGRQTNYVSVLFEDGQRRTREVSIAVADQGAFDRMQANKDLPVYYNAANPTDVTVEGAVGSAGVTSPSVRFLAWTVLLVGLYMGYSAFTTLDRAAGGAKRKAAAPPTATDADQPAPPEHKPPKITTSRR